MKTCGLSVVRSVDPDRTRVGGVPPPLIRSSGGMGPGGAREREHVARARARVEERPGSKGASRTGDRVVALAAVGVVGEER